MLDWFLLSKVEPSLDASPIDWRLLHFVAGDCRLRDGELEAESKKKKKIGFSHRLPWNKYFEKVPGSMNVTTAKSLVYIKNLKLFCFFFIG